MGAPVGSINVAVGRSMRIPYWVLDEPAGGRRVDDHRQEAVLQGIAAEDVGDLRADDGAKAIIEERPGRMLARGAAAEVAARDEDAAIAAAALLRTKSSCGAPFAS